MAGSPKCGRDLKLVIQRQAGCRKGIKLKEEGEGMGSQLEGTQEKTD